jgi:hypothetical protein
MPMHTLTEFRASLNAAWPETGISVQLQSVDHLDDQDAAWVHAYLHRKEGDTGNADYWYRKARKVRPDITLKTEWEQLVLHFLTV